MLPPSALERAGRLLTPLRLFLTPFINFLYPPACLRCGTPPHGSATMLCPRCWSSVRPVERSDQAFVRTLDHLAEGGALDGLVVPFYFQTAGPLQALIHELKYRGMTSIGRDLGVRIASGVPRTVLPDCIVVPVPLHRVKLRERGYNQAAFIGAGIATELGLTLRQDIVRRTRHTGSQTHLSAAQREQNMEDAFAVHPRRKAALEGKAVLLVDDVITTGATVRACGLALRETGATLVVACAAGLAL